MNDSLKGPWDSTALGHGTEEPSRCLPEVRPMVEMMMSMRTLTILKAMWDAI